MTVTVMTKEHGTQTFDNATSFVEYEGLLTVVSDVGGDVAAFPKGEWSYVVINDEDDEDVAEPRAWKYLRDVPLDVRVKDKMGDEWYYDERRGWGWVGESGHIAMDIEELSYRVVSPFIEVVE